MNSSIEEIRNAIIRQRQVSKARQTQRKMVREFKEATEGAYVDVLDKSK